jgi:hypothetical protein
MGIKTHKYSMKIFEKSSVRYDEIVIVPIKSKPCLKVGSFALGAKYPSDKTGSKYDRFQVKPNAILIAIVLPKTYRRIEIS